MISNIEKKYRKKRNETKIEIQRSNLCKIHYFSLFTSEIRSTKEVNDLIFFLIMFFYSLFLFFSNFHFRSIYVNAKKTILSVYFGICFAAFFILFIFLFILLFLQANQKKKNKNKTEWKLKNQSADVLRLFSCGHHVYFEKKLLTAQS